MPDSNTPPVIETGQEWNLGLPIIKDPVIVVSLEAVPQPTDPNRQTWLVRDKIMNYSVVRAEDIYKGTRYLGPPPGFGLSPAELRALADDFWKMFVEEEDPDDAFIEKAEDWFWRAMAVLTEEENHAEDSGERICAIAQSMLYSEAVALEMLTTTPEK